MLSVLGQLIYFCAMQSGHNKSVAFYTLGCKLNFSETSTISRQLQDEGFVVRQFDEGADLVVINTCSVTDNADKKCRAIIRKALAKNPATYIAVVGCYAQLKPAEIAAIEGVDIVLGASEKFKLAQYLEDLRKKEEGVYHSCDIDTVDTFTYGYSLAERTRTFLKVQDGCDYNCSFCTIPLARGKSRSDSVANVVAHARQIGTAGVKEIVLTGVNTGDFGKGLHGGKKREETFFELVQALDVVEEVSRFRISSIEPNLLHDEIIDFVAHSKRFQPHFHIPLQSGSDAMLKQMRRRYLRDVYTNRVEKIKTVMPHAAIGVDVIVGFPGETDEHFEATYAYLQALPVSYLHVFTYSERPNTLAAEMDGSVPLEIRHERSKRLRILSDKKKRSFYTSQLGVVRPVLWEEKKVGGHMNGFTDNYVKVEQPYDAALVNTIQQVQLGHIKPTNVVAASSPALSFS